MHWFTIYNILKVTHIFRRLFGSIKRMLAKTLFKIWQNHINKNNVIIIVEWTSAIYFRIKQIKENTTIFLFWCKIVRISSYSRLLAFSVKCLNEDMILIRYYFNNGYHTKHRKGLFNHVKCNSFPYKLAFRIAIILIM